MRRNKRRVFFVDKSRNLAITEGRYFSFMNPNSFIFKEFISLTNLSHKFLFVLRFVQKRRFQLCYTNQSPRFYKVLCVICFNVIMTTGLAGGHIFDKALYLNETYSFEL